MKKRNILIGIIVIAAVAISLFYFLTNNSNSSSQSSNQTASSEKKERKILYWRAPMNPSEVYDKPGKSRMGMDLVPVYEDDASEAGVVKIDGTLQQNMNVKTEVVRVKKLNSIVTTNANLQSDERKEFVVTTKVGGWIEKLYVNYTGQEVKKGEKLIDIYSPQLVAAEQEFVTALNYYQSVSKSSNENVRSGGTELLNNSIRKLQLLDVSDEEIEHLKKTKEIKKYVTLYAPFDGTVITKNVVEGEKINPGTLLLRIADLSNLWLIADIYEYELSKIQLGSTADITFNFLPGKVFKSKVTFIYPTIDNKTRSAKVRLELPNYNNELKPSMFATISIYGKDLGEYPVVPEQAVIRSGQRNVLILDLGQGKFKPVDVQLGEYSDGYYQVLSGINEGSTIVTSAQFLIDSESNLRAALNKFTPEKEETYKPQLNDMDTTKTKSELIRKGIIHVEMIDKNKDGKLFQDIMDWNVISDEPGVCPECGMKLREFTIDQVKENLKKHGFKYKE